MDRPIKLLGAFDRSKRLTVRTCWCENDTVGVQCDVRERVLAVGEGERFALFSLSR